MKQNETGLIIGASVGANAHRTGLAYCQWL